MSEIMYGRTPIGQLIYDLGFTKLGDSYLARKHKLPIAEIRKCREAWKRGSKKTRRRASAFTPAESKGAT